jgi:hypothetical protein
MAFVCFSLIFRFGSTQIEGALREETTPLGLNHGSFSIHLRIVHPATSAGDVTVQAMSACTIEKS